MGRERPSPGDGTPVHISLSRCADPGGKKGGLSRPLPISPIGTADPRAWGRNCLKGKKIGESPFVNHRDRQL